MKRKRALLVGRFQPPHLGHLHAVRAAAKAHAFVAVGVGSAQHTHQRDDPFTIGERFDLLTAALADEGLENVHLYPLPDLHRHAHWVRHVEGLLPPFDVVLSNNPLTLRLFRQAGYAVAPVEPHRADECKGTVVRARWRKGQDASDLLPAAVSRALAGIDGAGRAAHMEDPR